MKPTLRILRNRFQSLYSRKLQRQRSSHLLYASSDIINHQKSVVNKCASRLTFLNHFLATFITDSTNRLLCISNIILSPFILQFHGGQRGSFIMWVNSELVAVFFGITNKLYKAIFKIDICTSANFYRISRIFLVWHFRSISGLSIIDHCISSRNLVAKAAQSFFVVPLNKAHIIINGF